MLIFNGTEIASGSIIYGTENQVQNHMIYSMKMLKLRTIPQRSYHFSEAVAESQHEIEHLGGVKSPFIITLPRNIIDPEPDRQDL